MSEQSESVAESRSVRGWTWGLLLLVAVTLGGAGSYGLFVDRTTGDPFTKDCAWYKSFVYRSYNCAYRDYGLKPTGPRFQLTATLPWINDPDLNPETGRLYYNSSLKAWRIRKQDSRRVDQIFETRDGQPAGVIDHVGATAYFYRKEISDNPWFHPNLKTRARLEGLNVINLLPPTIYEKAKDLFFSPYAQYFVIEKVDGAPELWSFLEDADPIVLSSYKGGKIKEVVFSELLDRFVILSEKGEIQLWDVHLGALLAEYGKEKNPARSAYFSPRDASLFVLHDTSLNVLNGQNLKPLGSQALNETIPANEEEPTKTQLKLSSDGSRVLVFGRGQELLWYGVSTDGTQLTIQNERSITSSFGWVNAEFSPDGRFITATPRNSRSESAGFLNFYRISDGIVEYTTDTRDGTVTAWAVDDKNAQLWTATTSGTVQSYVIGNSLKRVFQHKADNAVRKFELIVLADVVTVYAISDSRVYSLRFPVKTLKGESDRAIANVIEFFDDTAMLDGEGDRSVYSEEIRDAFVSADGGHLLTHSSSGQLYRWEILFSKDQSIVPTALDAESQVVYGEKRIFIPESADNKVEIKKTLFKEDELVDLQVLDNDFRLAAGGKGGLYFGIPDKPSDINKSVYANTVATLKREAALLGSAGNMTWYRVHTSSALKRWRAIHSYEDVAVAVGTNGAMAISLDTGLTWSDDSHDLDGSSDYSNSMDFYDVRVSPDNSGVDVVVIARRPEVHPHLVLFSGSLGDLTLNNSSALQSLISNMELLPWKAAPPPGAFVLIFLAFCTFLAAEYSKRSDSAGSRSDFIGAVRSDRPLTWNGHDILGLKTLALQLSRFIRSAQTESPLVIGIAGGWGSGKSSLMNLLHQNLKQRHTATIWFNAWHHQQEEHLLASLFEAIRVQAPVYPGSIRGLWFRVALVGRRMSRQLPQLMPAILFVLVMLIVASWLFSPGEALYLASAPQNSPFLENLPWAEALSVSTTLLLAVWLLNLYSALPSPAKAVADRVYSIGAVTGFANKLSFRGTFAQRFSEFCESVKFPGSPGLVIFIDDLDRCSGPAVLTILEAINFLTSEGKCIVVMGFDRQQVEHLIGYELRDIAFSGYSLKEVNEDKSSDPSKGRRDYARRYLEKLINLEVVIPDMSSDAAVHMADPETPHVELAEQTSLDPLDVRWLEVVRPRLEKVSAIGSRFALLALPVFLIFLIAIRVAPFLVEPGPPRDGRTPIDAAAVSFVSPAWSGAVTVGVPDTSPGAQSEELTPALKPAGEESAVPLEAVANPQQARTMPNFVQPPTMGFRFTGMVTLLPLFILALWVVTWFYLAKLAPLSGTEDKDPQTLRTALQNAGIVIHSLHSTPRALKQFLNQTRFVALRMRAIRFERRPIDSLARKLTDSTPLKLITAKYEKMAVGAPSISDEKVVLLSALDLFLRDNKTPLTDKLKPMEQLASFMENRISGDTEKLKIADLLHAELSTVKVSRAELCRYLAVVYRDYHDDTLTGRKLVVGGGIDEADKVEDVSSQGIVASP